MVIEILRIAGMRGEQDRQAVLRAVQALAGIQHVRANLANQTLVIEREDDVSLAAILQTLREAGYMAAILV
ncbi:MAG: heavy-metal-associated domain-containing protein [Oscillochloris sp.]|nr:heavy-metal-associated domain-containing protein [Oscillochloris sp.]